MIKIKMLDTGDITEVTNNVAFGLIDAGKAKVYDPEAERKQMYMNRQMRPTPTYEPQESPKKEIKGKTKRDSYKTK